MNCFLACRLPADSAALLAAFVESELHGIAGVQWVPQQKFHITTHFFGNRDGEEFCRTVSDIVQPLCASNMPLELTFDHLGAFSHRGNPHSVLFAGIADPEGAFEECVMEIRDALGQHGIAGERTALVPHCTIGRTHHPLQGESAAMWAAACQKDIGNAAFTIPGLSLMQTVPGNGGSQYVSVAELPFSTMY